MTLNRALLLVSIAGLGVALTGCSKEESSSVTPAGGSGEPERAAESQHPREHATGIDPALLERLPSLKRVEQALDGAPVNISIVEAERLEAARAWIAENKPELSERERELLAQMLVMMEDMREAEDISLAQIKGMGESQLLQLWSLDADGDGALSDEEAAGGMERFQNMFETIAEYNMEEYDADGDGELSPDETMAMNEAMMDNMEPVMEMMLERAQLVQWDSNGDGVLSDAERTEGEAQLEYPDWDGDGEISEMERMVAQQAMLVDMNNGFSLLDQTELARVQTQMQEDMAARMEHMSQPWPTSEDFDSDGDGVLTDTEQAEFEAEMAVRRAQAESMSEGMEEMANQMVARMMRSQYDVAVKSLDTDGDGLLANEEWEGGYDTLRGERDARMFRYLYDADRSGTVTDAEVARFMDAYESQSIYADADLDGQVDQRDLQYFIGQVSGQ